MKKNELNNIITKFANSGWDLIAIPANAYLKDKNNKEEFINAIKIADQECGTCGCEFDPLYKRFLELVNFL